METQKVQVISGLNSVGLVETPNRLEFHNEPSIDNQVCSDVPDVLPTIEHGNDAFRLVGNQTVTKRHLERTMVHRLGVSRAE